MPEEGEGAAVAPALAGEGNDGLESCVGWQLHVLEQGSVHDLERALPQPQRSSLLKVERGELVARANPETDLIGVRQRAVVVESS